MTAKTKDAPTLPGVKEVALVDTDEQALAPVDPAGQAMSLFERLATNPDIDPAKLAQLMDLNDRVTAKQAETAFNAAMAAAQKEMEPIRAASFNPQTSSKYADYAALDRAVRPLYTKHGFALSFDSGTAGENQVQMVCYVTHDAGHTRTYKLLMPADGKGPKGGDVMSRTHATGSATYYGMRYLLRMIFNLAIDRDDDGNAAGHQPGELPPGVEELGMKLEEVAGQGTAALMKVFNASPTPVRTAFVKACKTSWESLKARAAEAGR